MAETDDADFPVVRRHVRPLRSFAALELDAAEVRRGNCAGARATHAPQFVSAVLDRECGVPTPLPASARVSAADVARVAHAVAWLATAAARRRLPREAAQRTAARLGAPDARAHALAEAVDARRGELHRGAERAACALGAAQLAAFDWAVHATVSSDCAAALLEPKALLSLRVERRAPLAASDLLLELPPADLARLLAALAPVTAALEQLAADEADAAPAAAAATL